MTCVAIIPARGGSQRIPRKNIKLFHGKPIIAYSIETALNAGIFDRVIVSTDDDEIAAISEMYGAEVICRSAELSRNEIGTQLVMAHVLKDIECDYACCVYPCAPMMREYDLKLAKSMSIGNHGYIAPLATWLRDPGQFYFGRSSAFKNKLNLVGNTRFIRIPENIAIDINTHEDWEIAEMMYAELHKEIA